MIALTSFQSVNRLSGGRVPVCLSDFSLRRQQRHWATAFTLVELLTVIAIAALLAVVSIPAISGVTKSSSMNQTVAELAGLLDQARQYAIAQNTYVWVAMRSDTAADGDTLSIVILASKSGVDPSPWANYGAVPSTEIAVVTKPRIFRQIQMEEAGTFTATQIATLSSLPGVSVANGPSRNTASFSIRLPAATSLASFSRVVQFTPAGQARVTSSPIDIIEFGLRPVQGARAEQNNVAVIRINGLTSQTTVYRP